MASFQAHPANQVSHMGSYKSFRPIIICNNFIYYAHFERKISDVHTFKLLLDKLYLTDVSSWETSL